MENIETLALLENLRLRHPENDWILRIATACVAICFGYEGRVTWEKELVERGLVNYSDNGESAELLYAELVEKARSFIVKEDEPFIIE